MSRKPEAASMSFQLPSEIIVSRFLPTLRSMLASKLHEEGLTQQTIATHLGVTQAAVSKYISNQVTTEPRFSKDPRMESTVNRLANGLTTNDMDEYEILAEVLELIHTFEDRGPICELHEAALPALRGIGCDLCVRGPDSELDSERSVVANVRNAARRFAQASVMTNYIPNVGTNIGMALPHADSVTDVVAIPGRIYLMGGRIEIPANPEFGASRNVATTILAANHADARIRGAVNLATRNRFLTAANRSGINPMELDPGYENREARLRDLFHHTDSVPSVIYHEGAFGVEPITYVLGESAIDAVELAIELAEST